MKASFRHENMNEIRYLTDSAVVVRLLLSLLLGGILGFERGLKNRPAGLRTYILVCMGSCIVMMTNQYIYQVYNTGDPVRMSAQVISGIGFLGAGTIIVTRRNQIKGLTTAAGLWASACVGLAIGIGLYEVAFFGGLSIFVVLTFLGHWDYFIRNRTRDIEAYIEIPDSLAFSTFVREARMRGISIMNVQFESDDTTTDGKLGFICTLRSVKRSEHGRIILTVRSISDGITIDEL